MFCIYGFCMVSTRTVFLGAFLMACLVLSGYNLIETLRFYGFLDTSVYRTSSLVRVIVGQSKELLATSQVTRSRRIWCPMVTVPPLVLITILYVVNTKYPFYHLMIYRGIQFGISNASIHSLRPKETERDYFWLFSIFQIICPYQKTSCHFWPLKTSGNLNNCRI